MRKLIMPMAVVALLVCAGNAEATSVGLSLARTNLYNARMSSYNAQIKYYQGASLHYLKKMPALTARKYGYKLPKSYKFPKSNSKKLVAPTASTMKKAINASSVSELMSALKGFGKY